MRYDYIVPLRMPLFVDYLGDKFCENISKDSSFVMLAQGNLREGKKGARTAMEKSIVKEKDRFVPGRHCLRTAETFGMLINGIVAAERQFSESMVKPME